MSIASDDFHRIDLLDRIFHGYPGPTFAIRHPRWTWHSNTALQPVFSLVLRNPQAFKKLAQASEIVLGEAFIAGELDIEGDIFCAFDVAEWLFDRFTGLGKRLWDEIYRDSSVALALLTRGRKHSRQRDAASVACHYDLPVEFFQPWLGPTLLYSSAYFRDCTEGLDEAQREKLDIICRKLELQPGDRFMDIGCGWGSLALHAAGVYGAQTRGITVSRSQARVAARRIAESHLGDRCFVDYCDYRDASRLPWRFEKIASIGMFEHVGAKNLQSYFGIALDLLKPGGLLLNSGIVRSAHSPRRKQSFIDRYVFPDGELVTLAEVLQAAEKAGFEVRDMESLREHYALTLRRWVSNFQAHPAELLECVSERIVRTWLLYMAGSVAAFERGDISVCQILLRRPDRQHTTEICTRESWYVNSQPAVHAIAARSAQAFDSLGS